MRHITFVTSNDIKYDQGERMAEVLGFSMDRAVVDFVEIQADGETIARNKAQQAFDALRKPVVVLDDTWDIPGLNGFPGAYMKDVNGWFRSEDWLRLTDTLTDRRIRLIQHGVYQDEHMQHYIVATIEGRLLHEIRGESPNTPHLAITTFNGSRSGAEILTEGGVIIDETMRNVWSELADWFATQEN